MVKKIYAIWDAKTSTYGQPMFLISDGEALRVVQDAVTKPGTVLSDHPNDFRLDMLGYFNLLTGDIKPEFKVLIEISQLIPVK